MRPRRGLGVVLHAEERERAVAQAFQRLVIQVHVRQLDLVGVDRVWIDGKVVVVRGDLHLAGEVVAHRVVAAVMAEFELVCLAAQGNAGELMAEADSEDRHAAQEFANGAHGVIDRLRVAGAVGEEDAVGLEVEDILGRGLGGNHRHAAALAHQHPQNVLLDAEVVGYDMEGLPPVRVLVKANRQ